MTLAHLKTNILFTILFYIGSSHLYSLNINLMPISFLACDFSLILLKMSFHEVINIVGINLFLYSLYLCGFFYFEKSILFHGDKDILYDFLKSYHLDLYSNA